MTAADFLAELRDLDVRIMLDGDRLRLNAPVGVLTEVHRRNLAQRKPEVVAFLREAQRLAAQQRAIVPLTATGTQTPIFAVAGHNGDVFTYRALARKLGADQPFFGLEPPGLADGTEPLTTVEEIARYFAEQIRAFQPDGRISVAGYCAGGSVAFELARQLSDSGVAVTNLVLFGAPYCTFYRRPQWTMAVIRHLSRRVITHIVALQTIPPAHHARYIARRAARLVEHLRGLRRRPAADDPVAIRRSAVVAATLKAVRTYTPSPIDIPVDIVLPCPAWQRSAANPLRWSRFAADSAIFTGPEDCNSDTMLLPDHVAAFAAFVAQIQRRR